jgi:hypothetical protein
MIDPLVSAGSIPNNMVIHVRTIQANASPGSHYQEAALSEPHVSSARFALITFLEWFAGARSKRGAISGP